MSRHRTLLRLSAVLVAVALAKGCGDGDSPTAPPTPEPARPTTVTVSPATTGLTALGATVQLAAEVLDQNASVMAGVTITWTSSADGVATVDAAGLVTAVAEGVATITASGGSASGSTVVTVMQPVASVEVSPSEETVGLGSTLQLTAEGFDENGDAVEGAEFSWESNDAAIATVDAGGLVTGVAVGVATITASAGSGQGTAEITVMDLARAALIALYEATDGPNWVNSENWLTDAPLGEWYGVDTDADGRVVELDLRGTFDDEAGEWVSHGLSGPIPTELGNLANLTELRLYANDLTGPIPTELGGLVNLELLYLYENALTGPIPTELGSLANLTRLSLRDNNLTGPIPTELGNLANLESLNFWGNALSGPIPTELGSLANLEWLDLGYNGLSGPIPPELSNLANLTGLHLGDNSLNGPIPTELGSLANLEWLSLDGNSLSGPIPQSFLQLDRLSGFYIRGNESLCVPGTSAFVGWLRGIEDWDESESLCNAADVAALQLLYETTGGTAWTESDGWSGDGAVEDWHGVAADSLGRVTELDLTRNGLAGRLPPNLGDLARMTELRIGGNALSGPLPLSLAGLSLQTLHYADTELCAQPEESFRAWLNAIPSHEGTSVECGPLSERYILEALYYSTGGPEWTNSDNWLTDAPLGEWHGVEVDGQGRVTELNLWGNALAGSIPRELGGLSQLTFLTLGGTYNNRQARTVGNGLTGPIPPELGDLSNLDYLSLSGNALTGPIPPELGNLANLERLYLYRNGLTGPIPPELGNLANLERLYLYRNDLTGPIPPELGNLANLERLYLYRNDLTGPIPPELGNLANLERLHLYRNDLTGPIPPELAALSDLRELDLGRNRLTGPLPPELGRLSQLSHLVLGNNMLTGPIPDALGSLVGLEHLELTNNAGMSGPVPSSMTALDKLQSLLAEGTELCAPADPGFHAWLEKVHQRRITACTAGGMPPVYLTQAVQSHKFPVPIIAGRKALLRVFPTATRTTSERIPPVRATFYLNGTSVHMVEIPGTSATIPTEVDESRLATSANAEIPADAVQPGLEMVVEIDPNETLDAALGVTRRIPETGRLALDVRAMPVFDLTLVPFLWSPMPNSSILTITDGLTTEDELFWMTRTLLPVGDFDLSVHEPVVTSSNHVPTMHSETRAIFVMEGRKGHYVGTIAGEFTGTRGIGSLGGRTSFTVLGRSDAADMQSVMAHEIGHSMSLRHPPGCDAGNPDPSFPYADGSIGTWGYDFQGSGSLVAPYNTDLMSYCLRGRYWVSDYHFTNALRYRLFDEAPPAVAVAARSLLLWGGVDSEGEPYLEPIFVVDAPTALPDSAGEHRLTGRTPSGDELFAFTFAMPEVADGDGSASFAFALPVRAGWEGTLASITLSGPGGSVTLDAESDLPMAILRNPRNGQVRGILRDLPPATQATGDTAGQAVGPGLEVLFSRGIPDAAAWRR